MIRVFQIFSHKGREIILDVSPLEGTHKIVKYDNLMDSCVFAGSGSGYSGY